jgi:hypothetical protein
VADPLIVFGVNMGSFGMTRSVVVFHVLVRCRLMSPARGCGIARGSRAVGGNVPPAYTMFGSAAWSATSSGLPASVALVSVLCI